MTIQYDPGTRTLRAEISGEIDHHRAAALRSELDAALYTHTPAVLLLDLSGLSFMDSSGIGLIMGRYRILHPLGGEIILQNPPPHITRLLRLAGMERLASIRQEVRS